MYPVLKVEFKSKCLDVVFNVYWDISFKDAEWVNKGLGTRINSKNLSPGQKIKEWRKSLLNLRSKKCLIVFLVNDWSQVCNGVNLLKRNWHNYQPEMQETACSYSTRHVAELQTNHKEADTQIHLHISHCPATRFVVVVIVAEGTDAFVMCIAFSSVCHAQSIRQTKQVRVVYIDIRKVAHSLGEDRWDELGGFHAFTGFDTVSAFAGQGKMTCLSWYRLVWDTKKPHLS